MNTSTIRGFSLVELMVALAVAAVLMSVAAPSFRDAIANSRQSTVFNGLVGALQLARSESIKRSSRAAVCARASDTACGTDWSNGWLVFVDDGATPGSIDADEDILRIGQAITGDLQVDNYARINTGAATPVARPFVRFGPRGTSSWRGAGSFRLCDDRGTERASAVNISLSGDIRRARLDGNGDLVDAFGNSVACP